MFVAKQKTPIALPAEEPMQIYVLGSRRVVFDGMDYFLLLLLGCGLFAAIPHTTPLNSFVLNSNSESSQYTLVNPF
jgi:hypothetical protein